MPQLSIIIPTFNSGAVLSRALDSIVDQTFTDWEVLIMDGVSTDNTLEVAKSYNDSRIRIYSEPDKGIYDAMNKGIKKANGEWLYFLGSDDWLLNNSVLQQVFSSNIDNYDVVYGDVEAEKLNPNHFGEWSPSKIDFNRCHQCIFYRNDIFQQLGLYNIRYPVWADHDLNIKWYFSPNIRHKYIDVKIAHYSTGGFSSYQTDEAFLQDFPYNKLKRGRHHLSRRDKITIIDQILHAEHNGPSKIWLYIWKTKLKCIIAAKKLFSAHLDKAL